MQNALLEIFVFVLYLAVAIMFMAPFAHYFTVFDRKREIKEKIEADLDNVINMFDSYERNAHDRIGRYETELNAAILGRSWNRREYEDEGFKLNGEAPSIQKDRFMKVFEDNLMPASYDSTKKYAIDVIQYDRQVVTGWMLPFKFLNVISNIEKEANGWLAELKGYDNSTSKAQIAVFDYSVSFESIRNELTQRRFPSLIAIAAAIFLHLMVLFPYFFTYRDSRNAGLINELFRNRAVSDEGGVIL
jgi:hypothetical protein